jgi:hypothetical protein
MTEPEESRKVYIKELDLDIIPPNLSTFQNSSQGGSKIVVIGKPGTGKSSLIKDILFHKSKIFPTGIVMSGTEDSNSYYEKIFPPLFIYNDYREDVIRDFIARQKIARHSLENPWSILLLDDCTDNPSIFRNTVQQGLFKNGRHWKMLYILSLQYALDLPPVIRTNVDGVFLMRETSLNTREKLWKNYGSCIDNLHDFCILMDELTCDYSSMYIHNATISNKLEDCVFWYKASPSDIPSNFKVGCEDFHAYSQQRYNQDFIYNAL